MQYSCYYFSGHPPEVLTGLWAKTAKFRSQIPEDQLPALESPSELSSEEERDIGREASVMREQLLPQEQSLMDLDLVQLDTSVTIGDAQLQKSLQVPEPEFRAPSPIPLVTPTEGQNCFYLFIFSTNGCNNTCDIFFSTKHLSTLAQSAHT